MRLVQKRSQRPGWVLVALLVGIVVVLMLLGAWSNSNLTSHIVQ